MSSYFGTNFAFSPLSSNNMRPRSPPHPLPSHVLPQSGMSHSAYSQQAAGFLCFFFVLYFFLAYLSFSSVMCHSPYSQRAASFFLLLKIREQRQMSLVSSNGQFDSKANKTLADHWNCVFAALFVLSVCGLVLGLKWFARWQGRWVEEGCHHYRLYCWALQIV